MIHLLKTKATAEQVAEMGETLGSYIKLAVDVEKGFVAGGGALHADCEAVLLEDGSSQENVWGADWLPYSKEVTFESLINHSSKPKQFLDGCWRRNLAIEDPQNCDGHICGLTNGRH